MNNTSVESYLQDGCGRCDHFQTPACKVHLWADALLALRALLRDTELAEEMKWGSPTYTLDGKNVVMLVSRKDHCALSFFKGAALDDPDGLLVQPGPNSRFARLLTFTSGEDVDRQRESMAGFLKQAIELQRAGVKVETADAPEPMPDELAQRLSTDPALQRAFEALTPGRKRSHILYVGGAKKSATREKRAERCAPRIAAGKGFNER